MVTCYNNTWWDWIQSTQGAQALPEEYKSAVVSELLNDPASRGYAAIIANADWTVLQTKFHEVYYDATLNDNRPPRSWVVLNPSLVLEASDFAALHSEELI
jgi:hypothetical protein